jgi:hypothetical protein
MIKLPAKVQLDLHISLALGVGLIGSGKEFSIDEVREALGCYDKEHWTGLPAWQAVYRELVKGATHDYAFRQAPKVVGRALSYLVESTGVATRVQCNSRKAVYERSYVPKGGTP